MRIYALSVKAAVVAMATLLMVGFVQTNPAKAVLASSPVTGHHMPHLMPSRGATQAAQTAQTARGNGQDLLQYHGGSVMKTTSTTYAIFWEPSTLPDGSTAHVSASYNALLQRYLGDVGGSGLYNVNTEYYDTTGHIVNNSTFGGAWVDTSSYPASDCTDAATPGDCLVDTDIQAEVQKAMTANSWTGGLTHLFFVFTSWGEGSCFDNTSSACSFTQYCGYHSYFTDSGNNAVIYANMPYTGTLLDGCGVPLSPNNDVDADSTISVTSHEQMESVTDPLLSAWYDSQGNEIGDKCAWNFGNATQDSGNANESWHNNFYYVQQEWSNALDGCTQGEQTQPPPPSGPITIFGSNDGTVYALNTADGSITWRYRTGGAVYSSPAVANGIVYIGSRDHYVYALHTSNGSLLWRYKTRDVVLSSPVIANGVVYIGSNDGFLYAFNATTGAVNWRYQIRGSIVNSPTVSSNSVYASAANGLLCAFNASTGKLLWHEQMHNVLFSAPAVSGTIMYAGASDGVVYALNAGNGRIVWQYKTGRPIWVTPTVANGIVYIGSSNDYLYALNATRGSLLWRFKTGGSISSQADAANGVVYVGSFDRSIYALDASRGTLLWHFQTRGHVVAMPAVNNSVIYVGSDDHNLYALTTSSSSPVWHYLTGNAVESSPVVVQPG